MKNQSKKKFPQFILVDDDEFALLLTSKLIRNYSPRVPIRTFSGAGAAIEYLTSADFLNMDMETVLLTDLHMPEMDGFGLLDRLETTCNGIKDRLHIFVLSADAVREEIRKIYRYSLVIGFLDKPFSEVKLKQVLECVQYPG